ncbi:MAG: PAS domain S-box protein, partial [Candidatus Aminicenantes bacterium]|nr:PAS domain S-box protein [Candidatus Aminicenantes bacterium]
MKHFRSPIFIPAALIIGLAFLLAAAGFLYFFQTGRQVKETAADTLDAVADLKVTVIADWRKDLLDDAAVFTVNPVSTRRVIPFLDRDPADSAPDPEIQAWMDSFIAVKGFMNGILFDAAGRARLASPASAARSGSFGRENVARVQASAEPFLSDFHKADDIGLSLHIDLYAPVIREGSDRTVAGVFLFRVDPKAFLFPFLESWPSPSKTAKSYLVRRDGEDVVILSPLRFRSDHALDFRIPAASVVISKALTGEGGNGRYEGSDYRGVRVLSIVRKLPDTPWHLIVEEDRAVIFRPMLARISTFASMIFVFCFGIGALLLFWIKRSEARHFKARYETEHERLALVRHFEYLHKYANDVVFMTDRNHRLIEVNDRALSVYGYGRDEFLGLHIPDLRPEEARPAFQSQLREAEETGSLIFETVHRRKSGETFPVEVSLRVIDIGEARYHQAIIRDISERKKAERRVMDALREKEVLLREIHHRVKNNMQVISSLLRLQSGKFADPDVREAFQESQERIKSMALVHEKLYGTKDLSTIDFSDYVKTLTSTVFGSHNVGDRVALHLDLEQTFLDINAAVPCGLILNELVLNSLKHAFPPGRKGRVGIELRESEDGMIRLTVRDDGIGLPDG